MTKGWVTEWNRELGIGDEEQGTRGAQGGTVVQRMLKSLRGAGRTWAGRGRTGPKALEGGGQEGQSTPASLLSPDN